MLLQRVLTALVLLACLTGAVAAGNAALNLVMGLAFAIALGEWLLMTGMPRTGAFGIGAAGFALAAWASVTGFVPGGALFTAVEVLALVVWCVLVVAIFAARHKGFKVPNYLSICAALIFVPATWLGLVWLVAKGGWQLMLSVFMLVWIADVFAYFCGRAFGKTKMAPAISPGKTWAGAVGAVGFVAAFAVAAWLFLPREIVFTSMLFESAGIAAGFAAIVVLVAVSIVGDLFESALKRQAGIKDSGKLLPGHGGFYDRLDAAISVVPCAVALMLLM